MSKLYFHPKHWPIRLRLVFLFLLIAILPLILLMQVYYNNSKEMIVNNVSVNTKLSLEIIDSKLDTILESVEENTVRLYSDSSVQKLLSDSRAAAPDIASFNNALSLISVLKTRKDIFSIQIYDKDLRLIVPTLDWSSYGEKSLTNVSWLQDVLKSEGKTKWVEVLDHNGEHLLLVSRVINDLITFRKTGILLLFFNEKEIRNIFLKLIENPLQVIFVRDEQGTVLSSSFTEMIGHQIIDYYDVPYTNEKGFGESSDETNRYFYVTNDKNGWQIVNVIPHQIIEQKLLQTKYFTLALMLIGITVIIYLSIVTSKWITKPIISLNNLMLKVQGGDLSVRSDISGRDEIGRLSLGFNVMINRINEQIMKIYDEQKQKNEFQLNSIQMQINPHFLYNSLEIIKGMAERELITPISEMTLNLSEFYRIALSQGREVITIRDELQLIETYLKIQSIHLENSFDYYFEVNEEILNYKALKLVLQPLVENAIQHGIKGLRHRGYIEVLVSQNNRTINIEISDNGHGIEPDKLMDINRSLSQSGDRLADSYGIYNVNQRIRLFYGKDYGLEYTSELGKFTMVRVTIGKIEK